MARVLLHSLTFAPDSVSTAYLMTDLARQLRDRGHAVTVLAATPHYNLEPTALERQPLRPVWPGLLDRSDLDGITVWHVRIPLKGDRVGTRVLDFARFHLLSLIAAATIVGPYDVVLSPSPPLTIGVAAWLMGALRRVPSIYNVQELFPDFLINQGMVRRPAVIAAMRAIEQVVYRGNTVLVAISESFARTIRTRGVRPGKVVVIPNFVDTELYRPLARDNEFARAHGLVESFVVHYGGNIGLSQDWESLLYAAERLADCEVVFAITGDGVRRGWLADEVRRRGLENVRLLGYQPRDLVALVNASCDLGTIPMRARTTADTFPSKIYAILASGKPAVVSADPGSELARVMDVSGCGWTVPPDDPPAYERAVRRAFEERERLSALGERGREWVERTYSKEAIGEQYDRLIRSLTAGG